MSDWFQKRMLDLRKGEDRKKALAYDGVGKYMRTCNICGRHDIVFPIHSIRLCPNCLKKGYWEIKHITRIEASGYCDLCGVLSVGAIAYIETAYACFRCLWYGFGKHSGALRPDGYRVC